MHGLWTTAEDTDKRQSGKNTGVIGKYKYACSTPSDVLWANHGSRHWVARQPCSVIGCSDGFPPGWCRRTHEIIPLSVLVRCEAQLLSLLFHTIRFSRTCSPLYKPLCSFAYNLPKEEKVNSMGKKILSEKDCFRWHGSQRAHRAGRSVSDCTSFSVFKHQMLMRSLFLEPEPQKHPLVLHSISWSHTKHNYDNTITEPP